MFIIELWAIYFREKKNVLLPQSPVFKSKEQNEVSIVIYFNILDV